MYITADVVETCNTLFPDEAAYYGPGGEIRYDNVLMGDVIYVNQTARLSEAENAVQIEADGALDLIATIDPAGFRRASMPLCQRLPDLRLPRAAADCVGVPLPAGRGARPHHRHPRVEG